jgi:transcriptional regulator with XRE-family HTH domain
MLQIHSAMAHYVDDLRENGGLKGIDLANVADVSEATVSRWSKGAALPHPKTQLVLSDLHYIVNRLRDYYTAAEIRVWLHARHPQLDGARAIDMIASGKTEDVLTVLDRMDAGAFV